MKKVTKPTEAEICHFSDTPPNEMCEQAEKAWQDYELELADIPDEKITYEKLKEAVNNPRLYVSQTANGTPILVCKPTIMGRMVIET